MSRFRDSLDREWSVAFDGLLLGELRDERGIDLADVAGDGYERLESDAATLCRALCVLCASQIKEMRLTDRQFSEGIVGTAQDRAIEAIWSAAKNFFRPKLLSVLESNCAQRKAAAEQWNAIRPVLAMLNQPEMPESLRLGIVEALKESIQGTAVSDLRTLEDLPFATGLASALSKPASNSPATVESAPAA